MSLISMHGAWLSFGDIVLLDNAELHVKENERICLVGRNGVGKSTLLKILSNEQELDHGNIIYKQNIIISRLQQNPPHNVTGSVYDFVSTGTKKKASYLLKRYHDVLHLVGSHPNHKNLNELAKIQETLDHYGLWQIENRINEVLSQLDLQANMQMASLSEGWLRKAALGRALISAPEVLLLDEPTNHLDIKTINWLEKFLQSLRGTVIFISHDRSFIRHMATRIVDLDRGKLVNYSGSYDIYLQEKEKNQRILELQYAQFDRKLAREEMWIRQGIRARRTRNEGRVRMLKEMRQERRKRCEIMSKVKIQVEEASKSGTIIFDIKNINFKINNTFLIKNFSAQVKRGDKIGLVGLNGCGKTTLLKLILGQLQPYSGCIYRGTKLETAYCDQKRTELDLNKTVLESLAGGKQEITVNGKTKHVLSYLQDFLFHPKCALTPVRALSGGERNRLLLARLFLKPSNLLILDEPTNDLDVETMDLLEEVINDYHGTVMLVSHDRQFIENTVTICWTFEGNGHINQYIGGYYDSLRQQKQSQEKENELKNNEAKREKNSRSNKHTLNIKKTIVKLSYTMQRELEVLPQKIEKIEADLKDLQCQITDSSFFNQPYDYTQRVLSKFKETESALEKAFIRWEYLESLKTPPDKE